MSATYFNSYQFLLNLLEDFRTKRPFELNLSQQPKVRDAAIAVILRMIPGPNSNKNEITDAKSIEDFLISKWN